MKTAVDARKTKENPRSPEEISWIPRGNFTACRHVAAAGKAARSSTDITAAPPIDPTNCVVEYYLSILALQRLDYNKAWQHLRQTEKILSHRGHKCKALRGLRDHLRRLSPEPST